MPGAILHCPIRGPLNVPERAADGLTFTEEKRRIDCINALLAKGYPRDNFKIETTLLRFGNKGRNSFRADLAVTDLPVSQLGADVESITPHIVLVAEIKRDNADAIEAKKTQVRPALGFLPNLNAYAIYWDDVEQRLFYRTVEGSHTAVHETNLSYLPKHGRDFEKSDLRRQDLKPSPDLLSLFKRIEDRLHTSVSDKSERFEIILQLLVAKLYDEHVHRAPDSTMWLQDFLDMAVSDAEVVKRLNDTLNRASKFYSKYLPRPVNPEFKLSGSSLRNLSALIAPVSILSSRRAVVQDFYMYFAKGVYKWDLAQYFTPAEVVDFIVDLVNPGAGDQVKDPACGSADFLVSAFHHADERGADLRDAVWGSDNSQNAVQISILNMVLNGDGKSNITLEDSLEKVNQTQDSFDVMLCNPPFGVRIKERRKNVLAHFDLGHDWEDGPNGVRMTKKVSKTEEVGILFAELCVRQATPGGRIGIILPNGYLGNRSAKYRALREWLLCHTRIVALVAFPRFTFKRSGADVSASVLLLEKRDVSLDASAQSEDYPFHVGIIESVGWNLSGKSAKRIYRRDARTGTILTDDDNEPILDADFARVLDDLLRSQAANRFAWLKEDRSVRSNEASGWSVPISAVIDRADRSLDPKRWCERVNTTRENIFSVEHFRLGDVLETVREVGRPTQAAALFRYVELQDVNDGVAYPTPLRGWELPSRARHRASPGDIFVGSVWGSVGKWYLAGGDTEDLVVTNGMIRCRLLPGKEQYLVDVVAGLNTEAYRIQARAFATGSDGLAELQSTDLEEIVLPRIVGELARSQIQERVDSLLGGRETVSKAVRDLMEEGEIVDAVTSTRTTNWVQV